MKCEYIVSSTAAASRAACTRYPNEYHYSYHGVTNMMRDHASARYLCTNRPLGLGLRGGHAHSQAVAERLGRLWRAVA